MTQWIRSGVSLLTVLADVQADFFLIGLNTQPDQTIQDPGNYISGAKSEHCNHHCGDHLNKKLTRIAVEQAVRSSTVERFARKKASGQCSPQAAHAVAGPHI